MNNADEAMGITIPDPNSAYKLWINGVLVSAEGTVATTAAQERACLRPSTKIFSSAPQLEIIIQVSNHFNYKAGIWQSISIGPKQEVLHKRETGLMLCMCLVGTFIILSVYNLFIFILRRNEFSALWFSLVSLGYGLRTLVIGERPVFSLFPGTDTGIMYRVQYESFLGACVAMTAFVYSLFHKDFLRKLLNIIVVVGIVELIVVVTTPAPFYTSLLLAFQAKAFIECFICLYVTIKCVAKRQRRSLLVLSTLTIMMLAAINDLLYTHSVINTGYTMEYAAFFLCLGQAYIVATRISGAYFKFSNLTVALNTANQNLEEKVATRTGELESEKAKADELLLNILPEETAHELKTKGHSDFRSYDMATVMFIDIVGFTMVSEQVGAELLVAEIDHCFSAFDNIIEEYGVEKIKTIGDAYLCAGGLPTPKDTHARDTINAALKIMDYMINRKEEKDLAGGFSFRIRIGIHSGPVVAGIVGIKKFGYDIWGNTVSIASAMEENSEANKITISSGTRELVKSVFQLEQKGTATLKDGTTIDMYYVAQN